MAGTITITWSESVENHKGMEIMGKPSECGFKEDEMKECMKKFESKQKGCCEWHVLNDIIDEKTDPAFLLVVRNGVNIMLQDHYQTSKDLWDELIVLDVDKHAFMKGRVVNKKARHNLCFADFSQDPDYENKKGTVYNFEDLPLMFLLRDILPKYIKNTDNLYAEENYYHDLSLKEVGIGFHGDTERRKVIAMRLGETMDIQYQWFYKSEPVGKRFQTLLNDGDLYIMSEKAVGFDWMKKNSYTLRHAAHNLAKIK